MMDFNFNINVNINGGRCSRLTFAEKSRRHLSAPPRTLKGLTVNYTLQDDTAVSFTIGAVDEFGNPTTVGLGTPTVVSADPTIATATLNADGSLEVTPVAGKLGVTSITVTDTVNGNPITGVINLTVVAGTAVSLAFTAGTTTPVAPPAPPAQKKI